MLTGNVCLHKGTLQAGPCKERPQGLHQGKTFGQGLHQWGSKEGTAEFTALCRWNSSDLPPPLLSTPSPLLAMYAFASTHSDCCFSCASNSSELSQYTACDLHLNLQSTGLWGLKLGLAQEPSKLGPICQTPNSGSRMSVVIFPLLWSTGLPRMSSNGRQDRAPLAGPKALT